MRGGERWTALEFADVCEAVAAELRSRAESRAIAPAERLPLFQWFAIVKDIVMRPEAAHDAPGLAKRSAELRRRHGIARAAGSASTVGCSEAPGAEAEPQVERTRERAEAWRGLL